MAQDPFPAIIDRALDPARFRSSATIHVEHVPREEQFWEMFHGQPLDRDMTRETRFFESWYVRLENECHPALSIKRDCESGSVFVLRYVLTHGVAISDRDGNTVETVETPKWVRELVGQLDRDAVNEPELSHYVFLATVGCGRLPLTSLESPLPAFTLGQFGYFPSVNKPHYAAKHLELNLRSGHVEPNGETAMLLRDVFVGVSLSPYTDFVSRSLALLREAQAKKMIDVIQRADFLTWLLRLQWRHLNAYDLVMFHHRGANYPDALLIDEVMRELLIIAEESPSTIAAHSLRRRGLRQGWFLRCLYAGVRVPIQPTSPGENLRIWPKPFVRVPDEQIFNPHRRPRELFNEPWSMSQSARQLLDECIVELNTERELLELGAALLLDRPFGLSKQFGESDRTPMLSHVVYSRKLAKRNLDSLARHMPLPDGIFEQLAQIPMPGLPLRHLPRESRPGVVSIEDAWQTADDFHLARTTRRAMRELSAAFDFSALGDLEEWRTCMPAEGSDGEILEVFDSTQKLRWQLQADYTRGYRCRWGVEAPTAGLRVLERGDLRVPTMLGTS